MEQIAQEAYSASLLEHVDARIVNERRVCNGITAPGVRCTNVCERIWRHRDRKTYQFCDKHLAFYRRMWFRFETWCSVANDLITKCLDETKHMAMFTGRKLKPFEVNTIDSLLLLQTYLTTIMDIGSFLVFVHQDKTITESYQTYLGQVEKIVRDNCVISTLEDWHMSKISKSFPSIMLASVNTRILLHQSLLE